MKKIVFLFFFMPSILWAQNTKRDGLWVLLKPFVGVEGFGIQYKLDSISADKK